MDTKIIILVIFVSCICLSLSLGGGLGAWFYMSDAAATKKAEEDAAKAKAEEDAAKAKADGTKPNSTPPSTTPPTTPPTTSPSPTGDDWSKGTLRLKSNSRMCVAVPNGDFSNGKGLILWTCGGGEDQMFAYNWGSNQIKSSRSSKCIEINGDGRAVLQECNSNNNRQKFIINGNNLKNKETNKCLDALGGTGPGTNLGQFECNTGEGNNWNFLPG